MSFGLITNSFHTCFTQSLQLLQELKNSAFNAFFSKLSAESDFTPLTPEAEEARDTAQKELAKLKYQRDESLFSRFILWLQDMIKKLLNIRHGDLTLSDILVLLAIGILFLAIIFFAFRFGISLRKQRAAVNNHKRKEILFLDDSRSANELFSAAARAVENNNWNTAVVEIFRATIKESDEHEIITLRDGLTALEAAALAAQATGRKEQFIQAANIFNATFYGSYQAQVQDFNLCSQLAEYMHTYIRSHQKAQTRTASNTLQSLTKNQQISLKPYSIQGTFSAQNTYSNTSRLTERAEK